MCMTDHRIVEWIRNKFRSLRGELPERSRRCWAAVEAASLGHGGVSAVSEATGIARTTIRRGLRELTSPVLLAPERSRRPGGGRKKMLAKDPTLLTDLEGLMEPTASGDPQSPLRWTSKKRAATGGGPPGPHQGATQGFS